MVTGDSSYSDTTETERFLTSDDDEVVLSSPSSSSSSKPFSMASISAASQVSRRVSFLPPLSNTMSPNTSELFCSSSLVLLRILSSSSEPPTNVSRLVFFDALFLLFD